MDFMKMYMKVFGRFMPDEVKKNLNTVGMSAEEYEQYQEKEKALDEAAYKLRFTMEQVDASLIPNKTDVSKLTSMISEFRNPSSQIIRDTVGKPPKLGNKGKWEDGIKNSDIIFASVVQCHPQLWKKVTGNITPASYLFVFSLNPKYSQNLEVLKKVSKLLNDFRDMERSEVKSNYSKEMLKLHSDLNNPSSTPHTVLDTTLLTKVGITDEMSDIRITNGFIYDNTPLPNKRLPSDGILPFLRFKEKGFGTNVSFSYAMRLIPAQYYV